MRNNENKTTKLPFFGLGKILPYLKPFWKSFIFILVMGLLASADDVIMPLFQKHVLNKFIGEHYASEPIDQIVATKDGFIFHEYKVLYDTVDGCFLSDHYAVIADMEIK